MAENDNKEIKLKINDTELKGSYANQVAILHSKSDFVLDFISMFPPEAIVTSRVITNPINFKRMFKAMETNLKKYESNYGVIDIDDEFNEPLGKVN
ncbi:MAG TPA: DUF3467 domain-containing protein [Spirochaetota bacterium]|nr:DUF3467 domain-containing protein [Spirochaetota bacterium]